MINGYRVKQAREIQKLTQTELAERLGMTQSSIAKMETSIRDYPSGQMHSLAMVLGFSVSFFRQGGGPDFPLGSLLFRCRTRLAANEKNRIRQLAILEYEICERLAQGKRYIPLQFPILESDTDPVEAAKLTRTTLGLPPDTPIPHLINKLEKNGIFVLSASDVDDDFDAFSLWSDSDPRRPVIILNLDKPADRVRLSCGHELAHLVLHRSPRGSLESLEKDAYTFAAEFLLPAEAIQRELGSTVELQDLIELKPRWGVSIQALIRRCYDLEILSERQYRYMFHQLSKLGWKKREPIELDIKPEKPRLLTKLAEMSFGIPVRPENISELMSIPVGFAETILSRYTNKSELDKNEISSSGNQKSKRISADIIQFYRKSASGE